MDDQFLKHLDGLGPQMFGLVVHLQEAVRERQRMRLFTTYWEVEENSRRGALLQFLYKDAERDFSVTERETRVLLSRFLTIHPPAAVTSDAEFLATVCNRNKSSIRRTDAQLDLLKDHLNGSQLVRFTNQFYILTVLPDSCRITWGLPVLGPRGMSTPHPPSPQISRNTHKTSSRILAGLHSAHQHWHQQLDRPQSAIYTKRPPDLS